MNPSRFFGSAFRMATITLAGVGLGCDGAAANRSAPPAKASVAETTSAFEAQVAPPDRPADEGGVRAPLSQAETTKIAPFGVPECDNYVSQFLACVEGKVSAEQRTSLMAGFEANRTKWRALATMREGPIALGIACRTAAQKSKEELTVDYGCEF